MLIGSGLEEYIVALRSLVAGDAVCQYDFIAVADVRLAGGVSDCRGNIIRRLAFFTHVGFNLLSHKKNSRLRFFEDESDVCFVLPPSIRSGFTAETSAGTRFIPWRVHGRSRRSLCPSPVLLQGQSVRGSEVMFSAAWTLPSQQAGALCGLRGTDTLLFTAFVLFYSILPQER